MLHCNGNKLAAPSFPNRSLPIAISMIATAGRATAAPSLFCLNSHRGQTCVQWCPNTAFTSIDSLGMNFASAIA